MRGKIVTAFIFLTMMTGAVSAAPVLDYTGAAGRSAAERRRAAGTAACAPRRKH